MEDENIPELDIRQRIKTIEQLPPIPELALRILKLRDNPDATVEELVDIIMLDPGLSAQIIRYANSPLFGQRGDVKTLDDAIFRVLGFETVMYLALGTAMTQAFKLPDSGPLGLTNFWRNATYSAALMQNLSVLVPRSITIQPGIAYICGLLHNIGFLVLSQLFESEYYWLNKVIMAKPDVPIISIEEQLLGETHVTLGYMLMDAWHMPEEITVTVAEHHNLNYEGPHKQYVSLAQISDQLLKSHNMSDADSDELSTHLYKELGLSDDQLSIAVDDILQSSDVLDTMVNTLSA